jgi:penicillin-binding protein 1B
VKPFIQPSGVVDVQLDKTTNLLATPACPQTYTAAFIAGTEPNTTCDQGGVHGFFSKIFGLGNDRALPPPQPGGATAAAADPNSAETDAAKKKKGFMGKITGIFKNDKAADPPPKSPVGNEASPH